ncbi:glycosyltransferase [Virgibacillus sp. W0181]|uniref:glycosyltransferase n=1 Tax=Virgibacillus sp. W0181 TaxID=3391581 RepID=UPI003F47BBE2
MKVKLVVPFFDQQRGNMVTGNRILGALRNYGIQTDIINATKDDEPFVNMDENGAADLFHGFHAYQFYNFMKKVSYPIKPYLITMTGTDLNKDLFNEKKRDKVIETLKGAEAIHVFEEQGKSTVVREVPEVADKLFVIPQGVTAFPKIESPHMKENGTFLFILPAGLRKIKNITSAIFMLEILREKHHHIRLWLVGPIIEKDEGEVIKELVEKHSDWIKYVGQIPHKEMGALFRQGDVVLNTSISEGQPSAILEAMAEGTPTLVSDNNGNRSIIMNEENGFVYRDEEEFIMYAQRLVEDLALKKSIGERGKAYVNKHHSLDQEIQSFITIYKQIVKGS